MKIAYVLPYPELGGGNKVIVQHARLLAEAGDEVTLLGEGPAPAWTTLPVPYHDYRGGRPPLPPQDLVIATFWTTVAVAHRLDLGPVAHFCQGYEGALRHLEGVRGEIEAAYALALPTLVVSPHLGDFLRQRFGTESRVVSPPLDPAFRPAWRWRPRRRPWVMVPGIFGADVKDVSTALAAVRRLRAAGHACRVLRLALLPLGDEERSLLAPDLYLCGIAPATVPKVLRRCDLLLLASRSGEGFGLPLLEAMAAGVPAVASRIPSTVFMAEDAAVLVPEGDAMAFAAAAAELLTNPRRWRQRRRSGLVAARRFHADVIAPALRSAVRWASGRARAGVAAAAADEPRVAPLLD